MPIPLATKGRAPKAESTNNGGTTSFRANFSGHVGYVTIVI